MSSQVLPANYLLYNNQQQKNPSMVVQIPGLDLLGNTDVFTNARYGDPGLLYGQNGLYYGVPLKRKDVRNILAMESSTLTISQKLEPEQGRASIQMFTLAFIDKDQYMSKAISPGILIPEILGAPVTVYLGYQQISFPEDYFVIFRGRVTAVKCVAGMVSLTLSDPNINRRTDIFYIAKTYTTGAVLSTDTTIPVVDNTDFASQILGPDATYDPGVKTYLEIKDEIIEYPATGKGVNTFTGCTRGARGTTPENYDPGETVSASLEISDNAIVMALKIMLSGWAGPYKTGVPIYALVRTGDPILGDIPNAIVLPDQVDANRDYGLTPGDYVYVTGDTNPSNDITSTIVGFDDLNGEPNRIILLANNFATVSTASPALLSFRSQFDTYPLNFGVALPPTEVDVDRHINLRNTFLAQDLLRFYRNATETAKTFIESQIYLPISAYSLTRLGRLSVGITTPPIADDRLQILDKNNILNPEKIQVDRATTNRKFFNEVDWTYDYDDHGNAGVTDAELDGPSLELVGVSSVLPIDAQGGRTDLGFATRIISRTHFFLERYKRGAVLITLDVNWGVGNQVEAGDVVIIKDNGDLQIVNFATGQRNLGEQMFEVLDRTLDIRTGVCSLQLINGLQSQIVDRFATISPSSLVAAGSTVNSIKIQDSFGVLYPHDEMKKWQRYFGLPINIHSYDWTYSEVRTLVGFSPGDPYLMLVSPALSQVPVVGHIVDIVPFSTSPDPQVDALYKLIHCHVDPTLTVTGGISTTSFTVSSGDAAKLVVGQPISIHNADYSILSPDVTVGSVVGTTVTVTSDIGFVPAAGQLVELVGFPDGSAPYRFV